MPPWVLDGGYEQAFKRLRDPATRRKIAQAITTPSNEWENLYLAAGSPDRVLLVEFKSEALKPLTGKTLAEVAKLRGESVPDTIMNLVLEDRSRVGTVYFMMSEDNIRKQIAAAVGVVRLGRGVDGARTAVHAVVGAPARLRQLRPAARTIRARRESDSARGSHPPPLRASRHEPRARSPRLHPRGHVRRRRRLRSGARSRIGRRSRSRTSTQSG